MSDTQSWLAYRDACAAGLPGAGAPWLAAARRRAMERFMDQGWPTPRQENWRHTSLAPLAGQAFAPGAGAGRQTGLPDLRDGQPGHWLVFVDGRYMATASDIGSLPRGARIISLAQALQTDAQRLQPYLGDETAGESPAALNLALAQDGVFIELAQGVALEEPIHLVFLAATPGAASFPRNIVALGAGAQATLVEHYAGAPAGTHADATLTNAVLQGELARDARLTHLKLQQEDAQAFHLSLADVRQQQGSAYESHSFSFGSRLARHDISTRFEGRRCHALLNGLYLADERRHVDHHTRIEHAQPDGVSREYYRGILDDAARGVFTGRIQVLRGADGTDAVQRCDSLLLSARARSDSRPELEIYADDVKCAHGATVGQLDEASLFYLRSRGLSEAHARGVMTYAFAAQAVQRVALLPMRERIGRIVRALLPGGHLLGEIS